MSRYFGGVLASATILFAVLVVACSGGQAASPLADHAVAAANVSAGGAGYALDAHRSAKSDERVAEFHDEMRKLWEDHITWTRLFIVSAVADLPDLNATTARLLENQSDIGDAIKPFYGEKASEQLTTLLEEHITTAASLLAAAKAGDSAGVSAASASWYDNADRIAAFLNAANPDNWDLADAQHMMREHLDLTLKEAVAHLTGDYKADIAAYDQIHDQILEMADMLSAGIVAQFPDKFD